MKKVIAICLLIMTFLIGGMPLDAKTTKKKSGGSSSKVIGKCSINPRYDVSSITLFANGKAKTNNKCWSGKYKKIDGADYVVRIPMSRSVDSLNVAAASAVAFWQLRSK